MHVCMLCHIGFHAAPIRLHNKGPHSQATQTHTHIFLLYTVFIEYPLKWIVYAGDQFLFIANFVACRKENFDTLYALHAHICVCVCESGLCYSDRATFNVQQYRHLFCAILVHLAVRTTIDNFFSCLWRCSF